MKSLNNKFTIIVSLLIITIGKAQINDTIKVSLPQKGKLSYRQFIAPAVLMTTGTLLLNTELNQNLQKNIRNLFGADFHTTAENYLPFVPVAQIYGGRLFGLKPKNDLFHQTANILIANGMMGATVESLKYVTKQERPDYSDNQSFPSGHTAIAFTNASLLFYEYKDSNIWYASSGYLFAAATAILRIANNKHYPSDVLAAAGIGMAAGTLVSYWNPLKNYHSNKNKKTISFLYPQIGKQYGIGLLILK